MKTIVILIFSTFQFVFQLSHTFLQLCDAKVQFLLDLYEVRLQVTDLRRTSHTGWVNGCIAPVKTSASAIVPYRFLECIARSRNFAVQLLVPNKCWVGGTPMIRLIG